MPKKKGNWNDTPNTFVAYLDIMGFRDRVLRERHYRVKKMLETFLFALRVIDDASRQKRGAKNMKTNSKPIIFSDSILLISKNNSRDSALDIIWDIEWLFRNALKNGIPIKGAITYGEFTADIEQSLYFGKPLIDAYDLQKELQLYGVVLHHTFEKRFLQLVDLKIFKEPDIFRYKVPMKSGDINHHLVDWTLTVEKNFDPIDLVNTLYNSVSGKSRIYVDNTLEFVREVLKRRQEKKT